MGLITLTELKCEIIVIKIRSLLFYCALCINICLNSVLFIVLHVYAGICILYYSASLQAQVLKFLFIYCASVYTIASGSFLAFSLPLSDAKTKCTVISRHKNAERSHNIKTGNSSFERAEEYRCLGTTLTNQNSIQEEIKNKLKRGNACFHSVQNLLSSSLLSRNLKIKIYRTIILPIVLYACKSWSLTLREERRLRVFGNRLLRRIFGPKRGEVTGE